MDTVVSSDRFPSYDLVVCFLEHLRDYFHTLALCSLVNSDFNRAAAKMLYSRVVLSPRSSVILNLRDRGIPTEPSLFLSANLPRNVSYVQTIEISGFLSARPPPTNLLPQTILSLVNGAKNLCSVTLAPRSFHEDLFDDVLRALRDCPSLTELTVNSSCTDKLRAPILVEILGLTKLTIQSPGRTILEILPDWLDRLSGTLIELHLLNNCGSVTPGVLNSFIPFVKEGLQSFSLGLSYSLTDQDVFTFLGQLPLLHTLDLQHYLQLKIPPTMPPLKSLRSFTVRHSAYEEEEYGHLVNWIVRAISNSPIECLSTISDGEPNFPGSLEALVDCLAEAGTLQILNFKTMELEQGDMAKICTSCTRLREVAVAVDIGTLVAFPGLCAGLKFLHTAEFECVDTIDVSVELATEIMRASPCLRRLRINEVNWEASWVPISPSEVVFDVREVPTPILPW